MGLEDSAHPTQRIILQHHFQHREVIRQGFGTLQLPDMIEQPIRQPRLAARLRCHVLDKFIELPHLPVWKTDLESPVAEQVQLGEGTEIDRRGFEGANPAKRRPLGLANRA